MAALKIYLDNCALQRSLDDFCTCDDRLLKGAKTLGDLKIVLVTPLELIEKIDL